MEYTVNKDLLYPDLSFKIIGVLYDVYNTLGAGHHEKYYHKGIAAGFRKLGIKFVNEYPVDLIVFDEKVGVCRVDFLVEDVIILEIKRGKWLKKQDVEQVIRYLESANKKLGILAIFKPDEMKSMRVVNWKLLNNDNNNS